MQTKHGARIFSTLCVLASLVWSPGASGQGLVVPSAGPINSSMAGASTAAPVDFGSSYWNPAAISGLERQEFLLGSALVIPSIHLNTFLPADSVGGVFPPTGPLGPGEERQRGGRRTWPRGCRSDSATIRPGRSGLGVFGLVGGGVNYAGSNSVPLLTSRQPPNTFGFGPIYANHVAAGDRPDGLLPGHRPARHRRRADHHLGQRQPSTRPSSPRVRRARSGFPTFPSATNSRPFWGAGSRSACSTT